MVGLKHLIQNMFGQIPTQKRALLQNKLQDGKI